MKIFGCKLFYFSAFSTQIIASSTNKGVFSLFLSNIEMFQAKIKHSNRGVCPFSPLVCGGWPSSVCTFPTKPHTARVESSVAMAAADTSFACTSEKRSPSLSLARAAAGLIARRRKMDPFPRALCTEGCSSELELGQTNKRGAWKIEIRNRASSTAPASVRRVHVRQHRLN